VGIEGGMNVTSKAALIAAVAMSLLLPNTIDGAAAAKKPGARTKFTVHPKYTVHTKPRQRGYGFLPGYRPPPDLTDWRTPRTPDQPEIRYWYDGQIRYGWGRPRFYHSRWNAGSFGPCWTYTPIGMMWNCGQ
jgi:hypothetical protein